LIDEVKGSLINSFVKTGKNFEKYILNIAWYLQRHFTWLAVIVIGIFGCILICIRAWMGRYRYYSWNNWKRGAFAKCFSFCTVLILVKIVLEDFF